MEKICIVDDYHVNIFILEEYLRHDYEVISFDCAKKCIEYLKNNKVRLVLMDCMMPEMDGFEATSIIKQIDSDTKVIGITANPFEGNNSRYKNCGMKDIITKPINRESLINILELIMK